MKNFINKIKYCFRVLFSKNIICVELPKEVGNKIIKEKSLGIDKNRKKYFIIFLLEDNEVIFYDKKRNKTL